MSSNDYIEGTKGPVFPNGWPKDAEMKTYTGGCHCGKFRYELEFPSLETAPVLQCNCTACSQKGALMIHPPLSRFRLTQGTYDELSQYKYNRMIITHHFCPICGSQMFALAPTIGLAAVNVNTLDDMDSSKIKLQKLDNRDRNV